MNGKQLVDKIKDNLFSSLVFNNPGGGNSTIKAIKENEVYYIRGKSAIRIKYKDIQEVYDTFKGGICTTNNLKEYKPTVFDSGKNGHSCNCTFLFLVLKYLDLLDGDIRGKGKKGDPFYVLIK